MDQKERDQGAQHLSAGFEGLAWWWGALDAQVQTLKVWQEFWGLGTAVRAVRKPSPYEKNAQKSPPTLGSACSVSEIPENCVAPDRPKTAQSVQSVQSASTQTVGDRELTDLVRQIAEKQGRSEAALGCLQNVQIVKPAETHVADPLEQAATVSVAAVPEEGALKARRSAATVLRKENRRTRVSPDRASSVSGTVMGKSSSAAPSFAGAGAESLLVQQAQSLVKAVGKRKPTGGRK